MTQPFKLRQRRLTDTLIFFTQDEPQEGRLQIRLQVLGGRPLEEAPETLL